MIYLNKSKVIYALGLRFSYVIIASISSYASTRPSRAAYSTISVASK